MRVYNGNEYLIKEEIDKLIVFFRMNDDLELLQIYYENICRLNQMHMNITGSYYLDDTDDYYLNEKDHRESLDTLETYQEEIQIDHYQKEHFIIHQNIKEILREIKEVKESPLLFLSYLDEEDKLKILKSFYRSIKKEESVEKFYDLHYRGKVFQSMTGIKQESYSFSSHKGQTETIVNIPNRSAIGELTGLVGTLAFSEANEKLTEEEDYVEMFLKNRYSIYKNILPEIRKKQFLKYIQEERIHPDLAQYLLNKNLREKLASLEQLDNQPYLSAGALINIKYGEFTNRDYDQVIEFNKQRYGFNKYTKADYERYDYLKLLTDASTLIFSDSIINAEETGKCSIEESMRTIESFRYDTPFETALEKLDVNVEQNVKVLKQTVKK